MGAYRRAFLEYLVAQRLKDGDNIVGIDVVRPQPVFLALGDVRPPRMQICRRG
jgi:hypothetical protein